MNSLFRKIETIFHTQFDSSPIFVRSPGRVNLIGEHTDYNEGFVLPAAVDKGVVFGIAPNGTQKAYIYSVDMDESFTFDINDNSLSQSPLEWPNYFMGVVQQLWQSNYEIGGFDCVFGGDLPIGAGMSSSAALEGGLLFGLNDIFELELSQIDMIKMGQRAENEFVDVQCGIMDQFANISGQKNQVFKLDCRSLEFEYFPFTQEDLRIVLCDTHVQRSLATSEYNVRRAQCDEGVALLQQYNPEIKSLRDVNQDMLQAHKDEFDPIVYQRCAYVVEENNRVEDACVALENNDMRTFGQLMYASHYGLRDKYEVSAPELDFLVESAEHLDGVYGARMMGAGFGGCTINLVASDSVQRFQTRISKEYERNFEKSPSLYITKITDGTKLMSPLPESKNLEKTEQP